MVSGGTYWIQGLNQGQDYKWALGTSFTDGNVKMMLSTAGILTVMGQEVVDFSDVAEEATNSKIVKRTSTGDIKAKAVEVNNWRIEEDSTTNALKFIF
jgi:hypothetical protein